MGTMVHYSHNSLAISARRFSAYQLDDSHSLQKNKDLRDKLRTFARLLFFNKFWDSAGRRMLDPPQVDFIKKTMLKQENIFQLQVRELHRLYSVQRMLMNELKQTKFWGFDINKNSGFMNFQAQSVDMGPSSGERSGSCCAEMLKMAPKGPDFERPVAADHEDLSTGVSAIDEQQTGPSIHIPRKCSGINIDNCSAVELTLSIGGGSIGEKRSQRQKQKYCSLKLDDVRDMDSSGLVKTVVVNGEEFSESDDHTAVTSSSTNFNQNSKQQAQWIFQDLSLSRT